MRRILSFILVLLLCVGIALAEGEIVLQEGKYVIGRDIDPGRYTLTCTGTDGEDMKEAYDHLGKAMDALGGSNSYGDLMSAFGGLYEELSELTVEVLGDFGDVLESYSLKNGDKLSIVLKEDTALKVSEGSCTLVSE